MHISMPSVCECHAHGREGSECSRHFQRWEKIHDIQIRAKVVELSKLQISDMCAWVVTPNVRRVASWGTRFICGTGSR